MNTHEIRARVDAILDDLPRLDPDAEAGAAQGVLDIDVDLEAHARRLGEAHQILVDALESVEKG